MRTQLFVLPLTACLASFLAVGHLAPSAFAQKEKAEGKDELPKDESFAELETKVKKQRKDFESLLKGNTAIKDNDAKQLAMIDVAAQWFTYRVTQKHIQDERKLGSPFSLGKIHADFKNLLGEVARANNKKLSDLLVRNLAKRLKEVVETSNLQGRVNGAIMLELLAKTGNEGLIDDLVELLKNSKIHDAVKLYALKGLKEVFAGLPPLPKDAENKTRQERMGKAFAELVKFLDPKVTIPEKATDAQKDAIYAVPRFFRREAIRALAQMKVPAVSIDKKGSVEGPIAFHLAKILFDRSVSPPTTLSEQEEAAIGLAQIRSDPNLPYQLPVALYLVGRYVAQELAVNYNVDRDRTTDAGIRVPRAPRGRRRPPQRGEARKIRTEPWRVHAARVQLALEELEEATQTPAEKKLVKDMIDKTAVILKNMRENKQVDEGTLNTLATHLQKLLPKETLLFKGVPNSKITLDEAKEE